MYAIYMFKHGNNAGESVIFPMISFISISKLTKRIKNSLLDDLDVDLMSELDSVVKANQRRCSPNSRSGKQEQELLAKYPSLPEASAKEKEALIAFYAAQEDEQTSLPSSLRKASNQPLEVASGSSPQQVPNKARRKSSKENKLATSVSPALKPSNPTGDLMFDMDEDTTLSIGSRSYGKGAYSSPPSSLPKPEEGIWFNAKGKAITSQPSSAQDTPRQATADPPVTPKSDLKKQPSTPEWTTSKSWRSPVLPEKLPIKEIMAQASSSLGKSNLSLSLSATPEKVSQKERKRQQQQVAGPAVTTPVVSTPEKPMPKMWQTPTAISRVSLKDVLIEESSSSSSSAVGGKPQTQRGASSRGDVQRTISTPPPASPRPVAAYAPASPSPATRSTTTPGRTVSASSTSQPPPPSPFPPPPSRRSEATLHLSLADIMLQEEVHKEIIRDHAAKRSLQEIQAEQEFLRWWDMESEKVRLETAAAERAASRGNNGGGGGAGQGGGRKGGRGRRRGGGGRRGRGEAVAAGQGEGSR